MAQKRVERSDIWSPDALTSITKEAKNLEAQLTKVLGVNEKILKSTKVKGGKGIKQYQETIQATKASTSALNTVTKERLRLEERLKIANSTKIDQNNVLKVQLGEQNKINKQLARESLGLVGAYEKQTRKLGELRKRYKDLAVAEGQSSKSAIKLRKEITKLDSKIKKVDASVGQFQRNVGNYSSGLRKFGSVVKSTLGAFGVVGGVYLFANAIRSAGRTVVQFNKSSAVLAGVLNTNLKGVNNLTQDAKRLGAITAKSAAEVNKLQIAYARLGFTQEEILNLTEGTIAGSIALNAELDQTAEITGAVVRTFDDLKTTDAGRILDILTASTQRSALNFTKLQTALPIVSGAANAAGVSFTQLVALLGKLSDAGIDASSSATSIRNIFIESAKQGKSYEEILAEIAGSTDKLTASNDQFGKRAAVSASILSNSIAKTEQFAKSLENVGGTAQRVADVQLDTLNGQMTLLNSAWEGFILGIEDGDGVLAKTVRNAITLTTELLGVMTRLSETASDRANNRSSEFQQEINDLVEGETFRYKQVAILRKEATRLRQDIAKLEEQKPTLLDFIINPGAARLTGEAANQVQANIKKRIELINDTIKNITKDAASGTPLIPVGNVDTDGTPPPEKLKEKLGLITEIQEKIKKLRSEEKLSRSSGRILAINKEIEALQNQIKVLREGQRIIEIDAEFRIKPTGGIDIDQLKKDFKEIDDAEKEELFGRFQPMSDTTKKMMQDADDDLAELEAARLAAQEKLRQDVVRTTELITQAMDQRDEREKRSLDNQLQFRKENISRQERLAEKGLGNTLAFEQAKAAKLEAERERIAKKQEKRQKTLAYLTAFTEYLKENPNTAAGKALAQVAIAETVSGLFYEGTESVGDDNALKWRNTGRDDYLIGVHKGERVIKTQDNKKIGNMSNEDLVAMAEAHRKGEYQINALSDKNIVNELRSVRKAVSSSGQIIDVDKLGQMIDKRIEDGIKKTIVHKRKPRRI